MRLGNVFQDARAAAGGHARHRGMHVLEQEGHARERALGQVALGGLARLSHTFCR